MRKAFSERPSPTVVLLLLAAVLFAAGCTDGASPEITAVATVQGALEERLQPTPTLVPEVATEAAASPTPTETPTPGPTPTATPSPTPTPLPAENVDIGHERLYYGNFDEAARAFQSALSVSGALTRSEQEDALWGLSEAYRRDGRHDEALEALE
ncbi:MAG: tetratricopeptide repeat protein, partial [Chloroflexota bacterium]